MGVKPLWPTLTGETEHVGLQSLELLVAGGVGLFLPGDHGSLLGFLLFQGSQGQRPGLRVTLHHALIYLLSRYKRNR